MVLSNMQAASTEVQESFSPMSPAQREWARCRHWIVEEMSRGPKLETIEDVEAGVAEGRFVFWASEHGAIITRIDEYPAARAMVVVHAGGDTRTLLERGEEQLADFARGLGCKYLAVESDDGHLPMLRKAGFRAAFTTMLKPIDGEKAKDAVAA